MTTQTAGNAGDDQRTDQADAVAHPDREVWQIIEIFNQTYNVVDHTTIVNPPPAAGAG